MTLGFFAKMTVREARGSAGRLLFFIACLAVGVAAVVGVASLTRGLDGGIRAHAKELLAADMTISMRRAPPPELDRFIAALADVEVTKVREFATMLAAPAKGSAKPKSRLAEVKAVEGRFPFYGSFRLDPPGDLSTVLDDRSCVVAPEILSTLELGLGDTVKIGGVDFTVRAAVLEEPDRLDFSIAIGPRVFVTQKGMARAAIQGFGARVMYRTLLACGASWSPEDLEPLKERIRTEVPMGKLLQIETYRDAQPQIRQAIDQVGDWIGLVALLSLVLGGIGVSVIVRSWITARTQGIAVLRCLGMRPGEVMALYLMQTATLAAVGCLIGAVAGSGLPVLVSSVAPEFLPPSYVRFLAPGPVLRGFGLGILTALVFALPPLTALWRVPPVRVLRADADPLPPRRLVRLAALLALGAGLFGAAWAQIDSARWAAGFTGALLLAAATLAGAARLLIAGAARLPRHRVGPYLRHALAALGRPAAGTLGSMLALGLGIMTVTTLTLIERRLERRLVNALPADAPSAFMVDIQPDQWGPVEAVLERHAARGLQSSPVAMARLAKIDGKDVESLADEKSRQEGGKRPPRWVMTREQRLTWQPTLAPNNKILRGALFADPEKAEISLEVGMARDLGVDLGSVLAFDVQGVPIELTVTSIRRVEWESFSINFFFIVEPGVLENAPHFRIAAARFDAAAEDAVQADLAEIAPNVSFLRVRSFIDRAVRVLARLALGVRVLGLFSVTSGLLILVGSTAAESLRRAREAALLKSLGVTRRGVATLFFLEHASVGLVAGAVGGTAAAAAAWYFLEKKMNLGPEIPLIAPLIAAGVGALATGTLGVLACARALAARPIDTLRGAD